MSFNAICSMRPLSRRGERKASSDYPSRMQRINLMGIIVTSFPPTLHDQFYFWETLHGIIFQPLNSP
jgi:hypothetical protein